ncbi:hypothetical protein [Okeania sp. KiyG1]|nr:hypothetical protein [Okeania sp. KiyG1]
MQQVIYTVYLYKNGVAELKHDLGKERSPKNVILAVRKKEIYPQ